MGYFTIFFLCVCWISVVHAEEPTDQGLKFGLKSKPKGGFFVPIPFGEVNNTVELPDDLTGCKVSGCLMCDDKNPDVCVLCDSKTFLEDKKCVSQCKDASFESLLSYELRGTKGGRQCLSCSEARDSRDCSVFCPGYRWDNSGDVCVDDCTLPVDYGRNTGSGTCGEGLLDKGTSCSPKCINGATKSPSNGNLNYKCDDNGKMVLPTAACLSHWDTLSDRDDFDWGALEYDLTIGWSLEQCSSIEGYEGDLFQYQRSYVNKAFLGLGFNQSEFTVSCHDSGDWKKNPRFAFSSSDSFEMHESWTLMEPVIYFQRLNGKWHVDMSGSAIMTMHDTSEFEAEMLGHFGTKFVRALRRYQTAWSVASLSVDKWTTPFDVEWLEIDSPAFLATIESNVTDLIMSGLCVIDADAVFSGDCTIDMIMSERWILTADFHYDISFMTHLMSIFTEFSPQSMGLMQEIIPTDVTTLYLSDTGNHSLGDVRLPAGLNVLSYVKFDRNGLSADMIQILGAEYTNFASWFSVSVFDEEDEQDPTYLLASQSSRPLNSAWSIDKLGFESNLKADLFNFHLRGDLVAQFTSVRGISECRMELDAKATMITNQDGKIVMNSDSWPSSIKGVDGFWGNAMDLYGINLHDISSEYTFDGKGLSMKGVLSLGELSIDLVGHIPYSLPEKVYFRGSVDEVKLVDLRAWGSKVTNTTVTSHGDQDEITFSDANVFLSPSTKRVKIGQDEVDFVKGLTIQTTGLLAGDQVPALISYRSFTLETVAMEVELESTKLNNKIRENRDELQNAVKGAFALDTEDEAFDALLTGIELEESEVMQLVPTPESIILQPWNIMYNSSLANLEIEWNSKELVIDLPADALLATKEDFIEGLLKLLSFDCRTNNDCHGEWVCNHQILGGTFSEMSTWTCVDECQEGMYAFDEAGCFPAKGSGRSCNQDAACSTLFCPNGKCVKRVENGEECDPDLKGSKSFCESRYCCDMCGQTPTCQTYPLENKFNCTKNDDCASGWCDKMRTGDYPLCANQLRAGKTCTEDYQCRSGYCSESQGNICAVIYEEGESGCFFEDECVEGTECCFECGFVCEKYPRKEGLSCARNKDCISQLCYSGKCINDIPDGGQCNSDDLCESGYCSEVQGNICVTQQQDGGECEVDDDCITDHCSEGEGNICFTLLETGSDCQRDSQCESGFCDIDYDEMSEKEPTKKCMDKIAIGETCVVMEAGHRRCESGSCGGCEWWVCECISADETTTAN